MDNFKIGEVWHNGETAEADPLSERFLSSAGERLQKMGQGRVPLEINGVQIEFLHPPLGKKAGPLFWGNDASLVLRLTFGEVSFLFCGDVEAAAEEEIRRTNQNLQSMVIKVPHHGSKTSNTPDFVEKVRPQYAVFTVKAGDRHRLPHPSVLKRYEDMGVKAFLSDRDGAITFTTNGKDLQVRTFLGDKKSF